jgi:hypothetical protein
MSESTTAADPWRRERRLAVAAAVLLVVWRSGVLVLWEQAQFDSDQAVFGLMAKHLAEGRAFPVFMYGQSYILAVQAWMAAPLFLVFGVSVTALKLPLVAITVAVAVLLLRLFEREIGLRPALGLLAEAPFILPAPGTAVHLLEASGGNLEPFLYVLLIWMTRNRPILCGAIFGIGFLQREFTVYGLIALLTIWAAERQLFTRPGLTRLARLLLAAAVVWITVQAVHRVSSAAGPGTSIADLGTAPNNLRELAARVCIAPRTFVRGAGLLFTQHWPQLLGTAPYPLSDFSIESAGKQGWTWASLLPLAACVLALARIGVGDRAVNRRLATSIAGYLGLVGVLSVCGYVAGRCGELSFYTMRYELLSLLAIVALGGWFLRVERSRRVVAVWMALIACWTLLAAASHARLWVEYLNGPPVGAKQQVIRALERDGVRYGTADYWMAYYISFLSRERIILASGDFVRIRTYNDLVAQHADQAIRISRTPCRGGRELVRGVYACP